MTELLVDVNSIAEAAANGLPFCGTDEIQERTGAVFHLLSSMTEKYSPDKLFLLTEDEKTLEKNIGKKAADIGILYALCENTYETIRYMTSSGDFDALVLTADDRFCAIASDKTKILLIEFTLDGSGIREVSEPLLPDFLALREVTGEGSAKALLEQYGTLDDLLSDEGLNFFGEEKVIHENAEIIKNERESLFNEPSDLDRDQADTIAESPLADISERKLAFDAAHEETDIDTSGVAFFEKMDDDAIEQFVTEAEQRLAEGKEIIFYDLKALLHFLGKAAGFASEIRKDLTHEEDNRQMSFFGQKDDGSKSAKKLYDLIMRTEQLYGRFYRRPEE